MTLIKYENIPRHCIVIVTLWFVLLASSALFEIRLVEKTNLATSHGVPGPSRIFQKNKKVRGNPA